MAFSIKDPETDRVVRELAHEVGLDVSDAVRVAAENELKRRRQDTRTIEEQVEDFLKWMNAQDFGPDTGLTLKEIEDEMYDEYGVPR